MIEKQNKELISKIKRKLARSVAQSQELSSRFNGNEQKFTFHAGWSLGFYEGKIEAMEDILDMIEDAIDD